jgi:O-antigen ligase
LLEPLVAPQPEPQPPSRSARFAVRLMQCGVLAVIVAASTFRSFDLDRFFVPKELVLHATALFAGLVLLRAMMRIAITRTDLLLAGYLVLSAASALFATNRWLGIRALAITASSLVIFWAARALREAGLAMPLLRACALAIVIAAITSLLQAYGVWLDIFSENRAPGGTLGNRNFIAHAAAFGLPLLLLATLSAQRAASYWRGAIGVMLVTASLVLTRSRAAWLAFAAVMLVVLAAMLLSAPLRRDGRTWRRLVGVLLLTACGAGAVLVLPNALRWRGDNPYLESVRRVADYQGGSGHGRLVQYERSLVMSAHHPLFGVGPGNWPVEYPAHAVSDDPSLDQSADGMTSNPWPSSDWIAFISERGLAATALLALALLGIAAGAFRRLRAALDPREGLLAATLLGTLAAAAVAGAFDAVLLLALPALIVWTTLGALADPSPVPAPRARLAVVLAIALTAAGAARSALQLTAMSMYDTRGSLAQAARLDPGNYRVQLRLARTGNRAQRCAHGRAAHALFPHARTGVDCGR